MSSPRSSSSPQANLAQRRKARRMILQALYQWHMTKDDVADIEAQFRAEFTGKTDWDYFHDVFTAIPSEVESLDATIAPILDRKIETLDPIERAILRLGTFELRHRIDVPYRVVINENVELAKSFGATEGYKYINSILDKLSRETLPLELKGRQLQVGSSHGTA